MLLISLQNPHLLQLPEQIRKKSWTCDLFLFLNRPKNVVMAPLGKNNSSGRESGWFFYFSWVADLMRKQVFSAIRKYQQLGIWTWQRKDGNFNRKYVYLLIASFLFAFLFNKIWGKRCGRCRCKHIRARWHRHRQTPAAALLNTFRRSRGLLYTRTIKIHKRGRMLQSFRRWLDDHHVAAPDRLDATGRRSNCCPCRLQQ